MTREERIARLEMQNAEDEAWIQVHAINADLLLAAAQRLRESQRIRGVIIDLVRAEGLPAMQPLMATLPQVERQAAEAERSA